MRPVFRRRRILVDRLQYRLLAVNVLYLVVFLMFFVGSLFAPLVVGLLNGSLSPAAEEDAARLFLALDQRIWVPLTLLLAVFTVHSMRVSHRVAGPLVQFRRQFGEIRDGHWAVRVKLRKGDYLLKEETAFNEMAASVEAMMAAKDTEIAKLETDLLALQITTGEGTDEQNLPCPGELTLPPATVTARDEPLPSTR